MDATLALSCSMITFTLAFVGVLVSVFTSMGLAGRVSLLERRTRALQGQLEALRAQLDAARPGLAAEETPARTDAESEGVQGEAVRAEGAATEGNATEGVGDEAGAARTASRDDAIQDAPSTTPEGIAASVVDGPAGATRSTDVPAQPGFQMPALSAERIVVWLAVMLGGFLVIVGVLFGLVAIAQTGVLRPSVRVALAFVAGTGIWGAGAFLRGRLRAVPAALEGIGMSMLLGAAFSANALYGFLPGPVTFGCFVLVSAVAGLRAGVIGDRVMAYLGLIGALLAPVVASSGNNGALALFAYLTLLASGFVFMAGRRRWPDLVACTAVGMGLLYAGWTTSWYVAGSVWMAHVGALLLPLPFVAAAATVDGEETSDQLTRWTSAFGALLWSVLLLPWVLPVDARFLDPRSGLSVVRPGPFLAELAAVTPALMGIGLALVARRRRDPWLALVAVGAATIPAAGAAVGWGALELDAAFGNSTHAIPWLLSPLDVALVAALLPLAVLGVLFVGDRRTGSPLPVALLAALPVGLGLTAAGLGPRWALLSVGLTLLAAATAHVSTRGYVLLAGLVLQAVLFLGASGQVVELGLPWVVGAVLVTLGLTPLASLPRRWPEPASALVYLPGVLAPLVAFPPLFAAWTEAWGWGAVGVLPVLLGAVSLLGTGVLLRRHRIPRTDPLVGVALLVTLAGVTFAVPLQLESQWLTVGWALEALAVAAVARWAPQPLLRATAVALGVTVAARLLLNPWSLSYGSAGGLPILNWTLYTWGIPTLCLLGVAQLLGTSTLSRVSAVGLRVLAMLTAFALVNVQVSHAFQDAGPIELGGSTVLQGMVRSISWGTYGLALLGLGLGFHSRYTRFFGFAFILLAASKVLVYDMWTLPGFVRVGSLIGLGAILLVSALLFERLVLREDP